MNAQRMTEAEVARAIMGDAGIFEQEAQRILHRNKARNRTARRFQKTSMNIKKVRRHLRWRLQRIIALDDRRKVEEKIAEVTA